MSSFAQSKTRLLQAFEEFVNAMEPAQSAPPVKLATPDTSLASAAVDLATPAVPLATPNDSKPIASDIGSEVVLPSEVSEDPMPTTAQLPRQTHMSDVLLEASEAPKKASKKNRKKPRTIKQVEASTKNFKKRWVPPPKQSESRTVVLEEPDPRYEEPTLSNFNSIFPTSKPTRIRERTNFSKKCSCTPVLLNVLGLKR